LVSTSGCTRTTAPWFWPAFGRRRRNPERSSFAYWLTDRKNRRAIPHRLENVGYAPIRNDDAKDGLWKVAGARQVIYALANRSLHDRLDAATQVITGKGETVFDLDLFGGR
jgi:hypothetical protein